MGKVSNFKLGKLNFCRITDEYDIISQKKRKEKLFKTLGNYKPKAQAHKIFLV